MHSMYPIYIKFPGYVNCLDTVIAFFNTRQFSSENSSTFDPMQASLRCIHDEQGAEHTLQVPDSAPVWTFRLMERLPKFFSDCDGN